MERANAIKSFSQADASRRELCQLQWNLECVVCLGVALQESSSP